MVDVDCLEKNYFTTLDVPNVKWPQLSNSQNPILKLL